LERSDVLVQHFEGEKVSGGPDHRWAVENVSVVIFRVAQTFRLGHPDAMRNTKNRFSVLGA